jgi:hypothetical protein
MNGQMTVRQLYKLCQEEIKKGNGNKYIVISDDNEGNGYHGMFYGFSDAVDMDTQLREFDDSIENQVHDSKWVKAEEIIILG